jgi:hypothetical protein
MARSNPTGTNNGSKNTYVKNPANNPDSIPEKYRVSLDAADDNQTVRPATTNLTAGYRKVERESMIPSPEAKASLVDILSIHTIAEVQPHTNREYDPLLFLVFVVLLMLCFRRSKNLPK